MTPRWPRSGRHVLCQFTLRSYVLNWQDVHGLTLPPDAGNLFEDPRFCGYDHDGGDFEAIEVAVSTASPCYDPVDQEQIIGARMPVCSGSSPVLDDRHVFSNLGSLSITASPNPTPAGQLSMVRVAGLEGEGSLVLLSVDGRELLRRHVTANGGDTATFSWHGRDRAGRELESGVYFWVLESQEGTSAERVLVVR